MVSIDPATFTLQTVESQVCHEYEVCVEQNCGNKYGIVGGYYVITGYEICNVCSVYQDLCNAAQSTSLLPVVGTLFIFTGKE